MPFKKKRAFILIVLLILDAFVLGGFVTLLIVNRLLDNQLAVYVPHSVAAAGTILDLMDDLLLYDVVYAGILLMLILTTVGAWVWGKTQSRLRYGVLVTFTLVTIGGLWLVANARLKATPIPPQTPTPTTVPAPTP